MNSLLSTSSSSCTSSNSRHGYNSNNCKPPKQLPYKQKIGVRFPTHGGPNEVPIPEPTAALCFAAGLGLVATRVRRS